MDVCVRFFADRDPDPQDAENSIQKSELRHLQWTARCLACPMCSVDSREIASVAEVLDSVVATRAKCDQWGCVRVVGVWTGVVVMVIHGRNSKR